jgi:hypothetical protein
MVDLDTRALRALLLAGLLSLGVAACDQGSNGDDAGGDTETGMENPVDDAGEAAEDAAEAAGTAAGDAAETAGDVAEEAGEDVERATE